MGPERSFASRPGFVAVLALAFILLAAAALMAVPSVQAAGPLPGSPIAGFNSPSINGPVNAMVDAPGGKVVIGGAFSTVGGQPRTTVARLNANGTLDSTFVPPVITGGEVFDVAVQDDGKVVLGGTFTHVDGEDWYEWEDDDDWYEQGLSRLIRLNTDGTLDTDFRPGYVSSAVHQVEIREDDQHIVVAGSFIDYWGDFGSRVAVLLPDGSTDDDFYATNINGAVRTFALGPDDSIYIGGQFTQVGGQVRPRVAKLDPDGDLDFTYQADLGAWTNLATVTAVALLPDEKLLVGGEFHAFVPHPYNENEPHRNRTARLNVDGSLDFGYAAAGSNAATEITTFVPLADGHIYYSNIRTGDLGLTLHRTRANGGLDWTFNPNQFGFRAERPSANGDIRAILPRPGGHVLIGGSFTAIGGKPASRIALLRGTPPRPAKIRFNGKPKVRGKLKQGKRDVIEIDVKIANSGEMGISRGKLNNDGGRVCPKLSKKVASSFKPILGFRGCFWISQYPDSSGNHTATIRYKPAKGKIKKGRKYKFVFTASLTERVTERKLPRIRTTVTLKAR